MQRRMALAQQLVCYSSRTLSDIAMACGFSSASHFSNRFKQVTGKKTTLIIIIRGVMIQNEVDGFDVRLLDWKKENNNG